MQLKDLILKTIVFTFISAAISASAQAETGVEGTYKFAGWECGSGATPSSFFPAGYSGSFDISISASSTELTSKATIFTKMTAETGKPLLEFYQGILETKKALPEGPDKAEEIESVTKFISAIQDGMNGISCSVTTVSKYTISGTKIQVGQVSKSSNCPGSELQAQDQQDQSVYELKENVLRVTDAKAFSYVCPTGDVVTAVFQK